MIGKYMHENRTIVFAVFLIVFSISAYGQESGPSVYPLTWQPVEYASRYEVVVEVLTRMNAWVEFARKTSETSSVEIPFFPGSYRFRVGAYDLKGDPSSSSNWEYFEVRAAQVIPVTPAENKPAAKNEPESPPALVETQPVIEHINQTVVYQNVTPPPIPEESEKSFFRIEFLYQPLIVLPFSDFNKPYSTMPIQLLGFGFRLAIMPLTTAIGVFGLEISPSWNFLSYNFSSATLYTHIITTQLLLIWQIRPFSRDTAINIRFGGGITNIVSRLESSQSSDTQKTKSASLSAGLSFIKFFNEYAFINAGIDYLHIFKKDDSTLNYLRPFLSLGVWL